MVLHGLKEIAELLSCTPKRVLSLVRAGAPIRVTGEGLGARYLAEREALLAWARGEEGRGTANNG